MTFTRDQAARAVADAATERDAIQSNLLDLDNSLGIRLLKGTPLSGISKTRWDAASRTLASLWDLYAAFSAVIEEAAGSRDLVRVTALLTGPSVRVARGPAPLAERDLADTGQDQFTLAAARTRMRTQFADVAAVATTTEKAWNDAAAQLEGVASELARADPCGDETLAAEAAGIRDELGRLRDALNADPLGMTPDTATALRDRAAALAARTAGLARVRDDADARIAAARQAAAAASAAHEDALAARQRAAAKLIVRAQVPAFADPSPRLAAVAELRAAGRWTRLAAELEALDRDLAAATSEFRDTERWMAGLLARRDELRGLLDAYQAKAARLGAIEDLASLHEEARDLLWTAPCDLEVAEQAVSRYQHEVLTRRARGSRGSGSRRSSGRSVRGHLGAGLVEIPPVPYRDPASAVLANPHVPENRTSSYHIAAQTAAVQVGAREGSTGDELLAAADRLGRLAAMDEARRQELTATILRMALEHPPPGKILGCQPDERSLRFGLERCYRAQARLAPDRKRRIELVDMANAIRPRTFV